MDKLKNPISVLLGNVIQSMRKTSDFATEEISDILDIKPSAYRMIESGNANINSSKLIDLLKIPCFHSLIYDKVCKFLIGAQLLEPKRKTLNSLLKGLRDLFYYDSDIKEIFELSDHPIETLFENEKLLSEFYSNEMVIASTQINLETAVKVDVSKLKKLILEIEDDSLCILQPFIAGALSQYEKGINELNDISQMHKKLTELEKAIDQIKDLQLGYLIHDSLKWRNKHQFTHLSAIIYDYANLANWDILEKFKDNLTQIWKSKFIESKYILVAKTKSEIKSSITEFYKVLADVYKKNSSMEEFDESYEEGLKKVKIAIISPHAKILQQMNLSDSQRELWLYEDGSYKYAFTTDYTKTFGENKKEVTIPKYVILTNKKTRFYFTQFQELLKDVEFIKP